MRDQKIKEKNRKIAIAQKQLIQQQKYEEIELECTRNLEKEISALETKLKA